MIKDDQFLAQILNTLHNRIDDNLDNATPDNELIQFFEAPHDYATLKSWIQAYVAGSNINASPQEIATLTAQVAASLINPSNLRWGGYDANGTWHDPGWTWGYGGLWQ